MRTFRQWLEDAGQVHTTYSNANYPEFDAAMNSKNVARNSPKPKKELSFNADKLFGKTMKKKMAKDSK